VKDHIVHDFLNAFPGELSPDCIILPQGTFVYDQGFEFVLHVVPDDQFTPQRQLLFFRRQHRLDSKKGWKGIKLGELREKP